MYGDRLSIDPRVSFLSEHAQVNGVEGLNVITVLNVIKS